jgi:hypothetical protein
MQMTVTTSGTEIEKLRTFSDISEDFKVVDVGINNDGLYTAF